ncbi:hypothetical protein ENUP19_0350G0008 [Entamoeba nuttalli]|uniref:NOT2/NOT3/NOT5 C-terminal domain-containing protein n=2 Tax=Entamoeba nuttalli TaxID=412467 RepID=K2HR03_ENTNP|nr:hypothetical protein ENU1_167620 [Entamoeba nuttalli P19]EKE38400.1 hypothetical protein ENU1_167620 [Entamoeba nuttalli P19]|eukprot:XP_008859262.1 hypothetical protein ENU1_167620 [Entamoeba nuttalli P19]
MASVQREKQTPQYQRQLMQQTYEDSKMKGTLPQSIEEYGLSGVEILLSDNNEQTLDSLLMKGIDLNSLGIDLSTPKHICGSFNTPFPSLKNSIPNYYHIESKEINDPGERIGVFKNELILFYMFYVMVGEESQLKAAKQLMEKKWRFSNKYSKWVIQTPNGWMEFDSTKWTIVPALSFNPSQADFMTL